MATTLGVRATKIIDLSVEVVPLGGVIKRIVDVVFASLALLASLVIVLVIAALLKGLSPGPVFFYHQRVGFQGRRFKCIKFRTMVVGAEGRLHEYLDADPEAQAEFVEMRKVRNDPRIVPGIGQFLRKSSLDELPQLINVLLGDMSVVGPRPVTAEEIELYGAHAVGYMSTRPGITGLWQVSGRSSLSFSDRVRFDTNYVQNWSIAQDCRIILRTARAVLTDAY